MRLKQKMSLIELETALFSKLEHSKSIALNTKTNKQCAVFAVLQ